jgi:ribosomal protein L7/L12
MRKCNTCGELSENWSLCPACVRAEKAEKLAEERAEEIEYLARRRARDDRDSQELTRLRNSLSELSKLAESDIVKAKEKFRIIFFDPEFFTYILEFGNYVKFDKFIRELFLGTFTSCMNQPDQEVALDFLKKFLYSPAPEKLNIDLNVLESFAKIEVTDVTDLERVLGTYQIYRDQEKAERESDVLEETAERHRVEARKAALFAIVKQAKAGCLVNFPAEVCEFIAQDKDKIETIRLHKHLTCGSLKESKDAVEMLMRMLR